MNTTSIALHCFVVVVVVVVVVVIVVVVEFGGHALSPSTGGVHTDSTSNTSTRDRMLAASYVHELLPGTCAAARVNHATMVYKESRL